MHPFEYMRRYIHVYTPTDGRPVRGLPGLNWEVKCHVTDPYEGFPSDRPIRKGFHPCYYLAARPHLASSAHLYEHTHTYPTYILAYMRVG